MKPTVYSLKSNQRFLILLACLILAAAITAAILLFMGAATVQGAHVNEPSVPDVLARCHPNYSGPDRWECEDVENPLFGVDNLTDRYFRYNPGGSPCLAFGQDGLYYACYNESLDAWIGNDPSDIYNLLVDDSELVGEYAALDFNDDAVPFISYYDAKNAALKLAYFDQVTKKWVIDTIVTTATTCPWVDILPRQNATSSSESVDQSETNPPADEISSEILGPQAEPLKGVGKYTSISIDDKNNVHISFQDEASRTLKYYFWDTGAVERCRTIDDVGEPNYETGLWSSIATYGTEPKIHISYFHDIYDQLRYARSIEYDKFEIQEITGRNLPNQGNGPYSSIAVDSNGTPNISYYRWFRDNPDRGDLFRAHVVGDGNGNCGETNNWQCDRLTDKGDQGGYTSISIDDDDDERISYYDFGNRDLKMWGPNGGTLDYEHNVGLFTSMDTFSNTIGVAYLDATDGQLIVIQKEGGEAWEKLGALDYVATYGDVGLYTSVAIRPWFNYPFISYYNLTNEFLKFAWKGYNSPLLPKTNGWTYGTVTGDYTAGTYSSIGISDTIPVIAYYNTEDEDLMFAQWQISTTTWISEEVDTEGDVGKFVDMAIDSNNIPHISYYDASNQNLKYATWDSVSSDWISRTWETSALDGMFTSIDLSPANRPYIAFYDYTNLEVILVYQTPLGGWSAPIVIDTGIGKIDRPPETIEAYLSLDYENIGGTNKDQVHVTYYDATTQPGDVKDLKYWMGKIDVPNTGAPVEQEKLTIDSVGDVGMYNSLAVFDANGDRTVCYYDETNGFLKVAERPGGTSTNWKNFVVDNNNRDTGLFCSAAVGTDGVVGISYYDRTRGALRYTSPTRRIFYLPITPNQ